MKVKIGGLKFQPWIPESYYDSNNPYGKLLILGESHYINDFDEKVDYSQFTTEKIEDVISSNGCETINYYRNFGKVFYDDPKDIWIKVAFANLIQVGLVGTKSQPTNDDFKTISPALWLLIENLKPQKMIVTSSRMWNRWFPDKDPRCNKVTLIEAEGKKSEIWRYENEDGYSYAMYVRHPSRGFSPNAHRPLIKKFLETDFSVY